MIFTKFTFPLPKKAPHKMALIGQVVQEKKRFENNGHIHVFYSPWGRGRQPPGVNFFQKYRSSDNLVICCKFSPFNYFVTVFSHSNTKATKFDLAAK